MFKPNTVFVVGAGASSEFGLPLGAGLSKKIIRNLSAQDDGTPNVRLRDLRAERLMKRRFSSDADGLESAFEAATIIQKGLLHAQSIDAFIDMHVDKPAVAMVGKLQIALEILRAEAESTLYADGSNIYNRIDFNRDDVSRSWLRVFAEILVEKARARDLRSIGAGVAIVCFNYDRCIEHYLIHALEATLGITFEEAHEVVYGMDIIHPYGSLGDLPSSPAPRSGGIRFGADVEDGSIDVWAVAEGLSTFTEEMRDKDKLQGIHSAISTAERLVFLGFGFQSQNVQLLTPFAARTYRDVVSGFSTGVGIHEVALSEIRRRIVGLLAKARYREKDAIMLGVGCGDLMRHNRLVLSAS